MSRCWARGASSMRQMRGCSGKRATVPSLLGPPKCSEFKAEANARACSLMDRRDRNRRPDALDLGHESSRTP
eukprot:8664532-Alexandrium_andersonii.AAC.1